MPGDFLDGAEDERDQAGTSLSNSCQALCILCRQFSRRGGGTIMGEKQHHKAAVLTLLPVLVVKNCG